MSDWDNKRKHERSQSYKMLGAHNQKTYYDCTCVMCGMNYMTDVSPHSIPNAMSAEGFLCRKCRPKSGKAAPAPAPPPPNLQISIEEALRQKKITAPEKPLF